MRSISQRDVVYGDDSDWDIVDKPPVIAPFTGEPGIQFDTNNDLMEAIDIWEKFMPKYFLQIIVD